MKKTARLLLAALCALTLNIAPGVAYASAGTQATAYSVSATQGWQSTGVSVGANSRFRISYDSGNWTVGSPGLPRVGPGGYSADVDRQIYQGCKGYPEHPYAYLMGAISNSDRSYELHVGGGGYWMTPISGTLYLRINDNDGCLGDNAGAVTVTITTY
jgi:hypothetical protein